MHFVRSALAALLGAALVAGCGGGGGGDNNTDRVAYPAAAAPGANGTSTANGSWLTLTPGTVALAGYEGEAVRFTVKATSTRTFDKPFNVGIIDSTGVVSSQISLSKQSDLEYVVGMETRALTAGNHATTLQVRLCEDAPLVCSKPLPGSPWSVPLTVTVKPAAQAPLSKIPSLLPWTNANGNATQNAYVPFSFAPTSFTQRWLKPESADTAITAPVVENGRLFALRSTSGQREIVAMNEASGEELWRAPLDSSSGYDRLAAGNGKVFVRAGGAGIYFLLTYDQATGQPLGKTQISGQYREAIPTVLGDTVYLSRSDTVEKRDAATGTTLWNNANLAGSTNVWTVVADAAHAYTVQRDQLVELDAGNGSVLSSFQDPDITLNFSQGAAVVLGGKTALLSSGYQLFAFDLQSHTPAWKVKSAVLGPAVLANDMVYTLTNDPPNYAMALEARSAATGILQWRSAPMIGTAYDWSSGRLILTPNLAFISTEEGTMAFDLATHAIVWTHPVGGQMALSDRGVLYIAGRGGKMVAINLR